MTFYIENNDNYEVISFQEIIIYNITGKMLNKLNYHQFQFVYSSFHFLWFLFYSKPILILIIASDLKLVLY